MADEHAERIEPPFCIRHGYAPNKAAPPIRIREEAPEDSRRTIIEIAAQSGWDYDGILQLAIGLGKRSWEPPEAIQSGTSARVQLCRLVSTWEWFTVYDFGEHLYTAMYDWPILGEPEDDFVRKINDYFEHSGVGWQLIDGKITSRCSEVFEASVRTVIPAMQESGLQTAEREIHEAVSDLSRRPIPDLTDQRGRHISGRRRTIERRCRTDRRHRDHRRNLSLTETSGVGLLAAKKQPGLRLDRAWEAHCNGVHAYHAWAVEMRDGG